MAHSGMGVLGWTRGLGVVHLVLVTLEELLVVSL